MFGKGTREEAGHVVRCEGHRLEEVVLRVASPQGIWALRFGPLWPLASERLAGAGTKQELGKLRDSQTSLRKGSRPP